MKNNHLPCPVFVYMFTAVCSQPHQREPEIQWPCLIFSFQHQTWEELDLFQNQHRGIFQLGPSRMSHKKLTFHFRLPLRGWEALHQKNLLKSLQGLPIFMSRNCSSFTIHCASWRAVSIVISLWRFKYVHGRTINGEIPHPPFFRNTYFFAKWIDTNQNTFWKKTTQLC